MTRVADTDITITNKMRKNTKKTNKNQNSKLYRRHSTKLQKLQKQNYSSWGRLTL
jgi:hypothetical protein